MTRPLAFTYHGEGVMTALSARMADEAYGAGEVVTLAPVEERSEVSHNHQFAWLKPAWESLPEHLMQEYPSPEHLRKRALINTGWANIQDYPCGTRAEAMRWHSNLRKIVDEYAVIQMENTVVRVITAQSQSLRAMGKDKFQASKTAIIEYVAGLLESSPEEVSSAAKGGEDKLNKRSPVAA